MRYLLVILTLVAGLKLMGDGLKTLKHQAQGRLVEALELSEGR